MSKEPIQLGHSVERHSHHHASDHQHGSSKDESRSAQRTDRQFGTDSLSVAEQVFGILFVSIMFIGFISLIIFAIFR